MKLDELIEEINELEPDEKLEWLVEFADQLPPLSADRRAAPLPEQCRVQECQTPVYLWVEQVDGKVHLEADVPKKSPTVRGLVALLVVGLEGAPVADVQNMREDLLDQIGMTSQLGMTRQQGLRGIVRRLKHALPINIPL